MLKLNLLESRAKQKFKNFLIASSLLLFSLVPAQSEEQTPLILTIPEEVIVEDDPGGAVSAYLLEIELYRAFGVKVKINGLCGSACTLFLSLRKDDLVCYLNEDTYLLFHRSYLAHKDDNGDIIPGPVFGPWGFMSMLDKDVQLRLIQDGFLETKTPDDWIAYKASDFLNKC